MSNSKNRAKRSVASSRLTSKGQATVPASVRRKLNLNPGDTVLFEESRTGAILIRKARPLDLEFLSALESTFSEWKSDEDDRAYRDL